MKALAYEDLADVTVRRSINALEQAQVNVSVSKLATLAKALDFDFIALVVICTALKENSEPEKILERALSVLAAFSSEGGFSQVRAQLSDGSIILRRPGKPRNTRNIAAVKHLRAQGVSQTEASKELSLAKSTVNRYWKL